MPPLRGEESPTDPRLEEVRSNESLARASHAEGWHHFPTSHSFTVPSAPPVARVRSSGLNATAYTAFCRLACVWPSRGCPLHSVNRGGGANTLFVAAFAR